MAHTAKSRPGEAACLLEIISHLKYDAITPGEKDLLPGPTQLRALSEKFKIPWVSANLFNRHHEFFFAPFLIKKFQGLRVGISGVIDEYLAAGWSDSLQVEPAEKAAMQIVAELRPRCDLIILLAHLNYERSVKLAQTVPEIDLIISGHAAFREKPVRQIGSTRIVQIRQFGQYVGDLLLHLNQKKISHHEEFLQPLDDTVPEDSLTRALVEACERRYMPVTPVQRTLRQAPGYFVLAEKCRKCHAKIYAQWVRTGHARAFARLVGSQRDDRTCLACHTTGFEISNGFRNLRTNPDLVNVQCEVCHGPRFQHTRYFEAIYRDRPVPENPDLTSTVSPAICRDCHTQSRDPDFDLVTGLKKIAHTE